jgi:hypothetical protein
MERKQLEDSATETDAKVEGWMTNLYTFHLSFCTLKICQWLYQFSFYLHRLYSCERLFYVRNYGEISLYKQTYRRKQRWLCYFKRGISTNFMKQHSAKSQQ